MSAGKIGSIYFISAENKYREIRDDTGQCCTPFIIAARNGHEGVVKLLLKYQVNLEQEGTIRMDSCIIDGASALWCASGGGHLSLVKTLVRAGADVNHATSTQSTPLRPACFEGRLDIASYLVKHGANIHSLNKYHNSCLMIASYKGHLDVVSYLLEQGVDPNQKALCGATAAHFAAECGHLDIIKQLLKYKAEMSRNKHGLTPLLVAAERTRLGVVEYLLKQDFVSVEEKIEALELLGASFANDKDNYSLELAYRFMKQAMILRYADLINVISKPVMETIPAYRNRKECQTIDELVQIQNNDDQLHMESLTIRERILGTRNPDVLHSIVFRGAVLADQSRFDFCIELWLHALRLAKSNQISVSKDLLRFSQVFAQMTCRGVPIQFKYLETVLSAAVDELQANKLKISLSLKSEDIDAVKDEMETNLLSSLYMIVIFTKLKENFSIDEVNRTCSLIYELVKIKATSSHGQSLLHLAVDIDTPIDTFYIIEVCHFPCSETTNLLIKCGADVDAMDNHRNTPLHSIVSYQRSQEDFTAFYSILMDLLEAGAHMDVVNIEGKTPLESTRTAVADLILKPRHEPCLKCISARQLNTYNIPYLGQVPKNLEAFINLHGVREMAVGKDSIHSEPPKKYRSK